MHDAALTKPQHWLVAIFISASTTLSAAIASSCEYSTLCLYHGVPVATTHIQNAAKVALDVLVSNPVASSESSSVECVNQGGVETVRAISCAELPVKI